MSGPYRHIGGMPVEQLGLPIQRKFFGCKEETGYDAFFAGHGLDTGAILFQQRVDYINATPQPVNLIRSRESAGFFYTFGRPMGDMSLPVTTVKRQFPWSRRPKTPTIGPMQVGAYVRAMAADMLLDRSGVRGLPGPYQSVAP